MNHATLQHFSSKGQRQPVEIPIHSIFLNNCILKSFAKCSAVRLMLNVIVAAFESFKAPSCP